MLVYHVQYTYTCKHAHPQWTFREEKHVFGQSRTVKLASVTERPATTRVRYEAQKTTRKFVLVSVLWNLAIFIHNMEISARCTSHDQRIAWLGYHGKAHTQS